MSVIRNAWITHTYYDSAVLMEISRELGHRPGVIKAAAMMSTPANISLLLESGLIEVVQEKIAGDDLLLAVSAVDDNSAGKALEWCRDSLKSLSKNKPGEIFDGKQDNSNNLLNFRWRDVPDSIKLALISVPGPYASAEAWKALHAGRNVFLFSDHVSFEDECKLKQAAEQRDLLMMGPECGTSIISGVPLGFANSVRAGPIGIVAASGSGLQEVTCLIDRMGGGISHAIGTGGRDLSPQVGGLMMLRGIDLLLSDANTRTLVLISKPPDKNVEEIILKRVASASIPVIVCFLGGSGKFTQAVGLISARTLEDTAIRAVQTIGLSGRLETRQPEIQQPENKFDLLVGLYSGGTLAYEAMVELIQSIDQVWSNRPLNKSFQITGGTLPSANVILDLGSEEFTLGQPHPMIDPQIRANLLVSLAKDKRFSIFLLDFILGFGSHPDPVSVMLEAIAEANRIAAADGRLLTFIASITGTDSDTPNYGEQSAKLVKAGVHVASSNAAAARIAGNLLSMNQVRY